MSNSLLGRHFIIYLLNISGMHGYILMKLATIARIDDTMTFEALKVMVQRSKSQTTSSAEAYLSTIRRRTETIQFHRFCADPIIIIIIIIIIVYYSCSHKQNQQLSHSTALIQYNTEQVLYIQRNITRFSTGILSCYIQALGSPQCRNLINTNRNNGYARILNIG